MLTLLEVALRIQHADKWAEYCTMILQTRTVSESDLLTSIMQKAVWNKIFNTGMAIVSFCKQKVEYTSYDFIHPDFTY